MRSLHGCHIRPTLLTASNPRILHCIKGRVRPGKSTGRAETRNLSMLTLISSWRRERAAVSQLSRLSDRGLADLGIQRQDFKTVARFASAMTRDEVAAIVERPNIFAGLETSHPAVNALYRPTSIAA